MLSAKQKVDSAASFQKLKAAQQIIQAQDAEIKALRRIVTDARKPKKVLRPNHPSIALEIEYRRKLECLINEMQSSVLYWLRASFKANEPEVAVLAQDALPAKELRKAVRKLSRRWQRNFNEASIDLAHWFSTRAHKRSTHSLQKILQKGGWSVDLQMNAAQRDILAATVQQNVSLIRSIPSQYFTQVEGMVMRSVQTGRDLHQLTNDLQRNFRVTRRRAELIARDQNNKVTAAITRARQVELGLKAIWVHSGAGKHPRPTHIRNSGKEYDPVRGWYDPAVKRWIHPGTEINCRCFSKSVVPGFS